MIQPSVPYDASAAARPTAAVDGFRALALRLTRWARTEQGAQGNGDSHGDAWVSPLIGVAYCAAAEGASATALLLAQAAAEVGQRKVLLVEARGDGNRLGERPEARSCRRSETARDAGVADGVRATERGVDILPLASAERLPSGLEAPSPQAPRPEALSRELDALRGSYGLIIVDLPPAGESAAACALAAGLDGVLLVVVAERTAASAAQQAKDRLESGGARILGVVLNKTRDDLPPWLDRRLP
jgi:Mrp family chromosome partitioning ATPase